MWAWGRQSCVCEAVKQIGKCARGRQSCVCEAVKQVGKCGHGEGRVVYVKQSNK